MSAPTKVLRVHKDAPETSVVPVDAYLVNEDGTSFTGGSGSSSDTVADKLAAANIHTVGDDSVGEYTLSDVGYMLNLLITTLLSK